MSLDRFRRVVVLAACALIVVPAGAQSVARLLVAPISLRLPAGATRDVTAEAYDNDGSVIAAEKAGVSFSSSDTAVVSVTATGTVRGISGGTAEIVVRAGAQTRRVAVTVVTAGTSTGTGTSTGGGSEPVQPPVPDGPAVVSGFIEPKVIQLLPTERVKPTFSLRYADGNVAETRDVVWNAFGTPIAFDPGTLEVVGVVPGSAVLGGRFGTSITNSVQVMVGEVSLVLDRDSVLLIAGAMDTVRVLVPGQGRRAVTQNLTWKTTDPSVLRVLDPRFGVVQARDGGVADLIVDGYGITRRVSVRVTPRVARIDAAIPPGTLVTLGAGGAVPLEARAIGTAGTVLNSVTLSWKTANPSIATIDAKGVVFGTAAGTTTVSLEVPGLPPLSWPVTVAATRVTLSTKVLSVPTGALKPMTAVLRGAEERDYGPAMSPQWLSTAPTVASVDGSGTVSAKAPGRATIIVTQPGAGADTVMIFVTGRALVSGSIGNMRGIWHILGANDTTLVPLVAADSGLLTQATWSPDRTRIAATVEATEKSPTRVVVMDADGTRWTTVSANAVVAAADPAWTRDGTALLIALRDTKSSSIIRVNVASGKSDTLVTVTDGRVRFPVPGADTASVLARLEKGSAVDLARVRGGELQVITSTKPREELLVGMRDGRLLVAIDSTSRGRPTALFWMTVSGDAVSLATPIPLPTGLIITDIAPGFDDGSAIVVVRARSWPGITGAALVVLRVPLDGSPPKTMLVLPASEKDGITVRSD